MEYVYDVTTKMKERVSPRENNGKLRVLNVLEHKLRFGVQCGRCTVEEEEVSGWPRGRGRNKEVPVEGERS